MTKEEKDEVVSFLDYVFNRINKAKEEIRKANYGSALEIFSRCLSRIETQSEPGLRPRLSLYIGYQQISINSNNF